MIIEKKNIATLIPYARNAKKHDDNQIAQIASSIKEFGFNDPVEITPDNVIIAGHGRVLAAQKLGLTEVPVVVHHHLNDNQRRAYTLLNNRLNEIGGGRDTEMLELELDDLPEFELLDCFDGFFTAKSFDTSNTIIQENYSTNDENTTDKNTDNTVTPPNDFQEFDENIETEYCCPKCGYEWSGKAK